MGLPNLSTPAYPCGKFFLISSISSISNFFKIFFIFKLLNNNLNNYKKSNILIFNCNNAFKPTILKINLNFMRNYNNLIIFVYFN